MGLLGTFRKDVRGLVGTFGVFGGVLEDFEGVLRTLWDIWGLVRSFGESWGILGSSGSFLGVWGTFEYFWGQSLAPSILFIMSLV